MYKISWDPETGGVQLHSQVTPDTLGVAPRPVFYEELDLLKLNTLGWIYPRSEAPLLWACNKQYFYHGTLVFEAKGANIYDQATLVFHNGADKGMNIEPVDVEKMLQRNNDFLFLLESEAIEFIRDTYLQYAAPKTKNTNEIDYNALLERVERKTKQKMALVKEDCDSFDIEPLEAAKEKGKRIYHTVKVDFLIASFSGGKDSQVVLDLCTRAIPSTDFQVIYSDTGYELPPSLELYEETKRHYTELYPDLKFSIARNHDSVLNYWDKIGTPSDTHRWCCSVMKTAPLYRMLKVRGTNKQAKVLAFDGVRAEESARRSNYPKFGKGKYVNVFNASPILYWNSSEIFLYIFKHKLRINKAYREGMTRVGCVLCPFSSEWNDMISNTFYSEEIYPFLSRVERNTINQNIVDAKVYIGNGNWKRRAGGRNMSFPSSLKILESNPHLIIEIFNPQKHIFTFLQAVGDYIFTNNVGELSYKNKIYSFTVIHESKEKYKLVFKNTYDSPTLQGLIKRALKKAVYCINCEACEVECPTGALHIIPEALIDNKKCIHCHRCLLFHDDGCIVANSLSTTNNKNSMKLVDYNRFGLRKTWLDDYVSTYQTYFIDNVHGLNIKQQLPPFKKWLMQSEIINDTKNHDITEFGRIFVDIYESAPDIAWELIWINLSYNSPIINWFVNNIELGYTFTEKDIVELVADDYSSSSKTSIEKVVYALFRTFRESPIGEIVENKNNEGYKRIAHDSLSVESVAYSLYKYAKKMNIHMLRVEDLYRKECQGGVFKEFRIDREILKKCLYSLSNNEKNVLTAELNMGLDHITLREDLDSIKTLKLLFDMK